MGFILEWFCVLDLDMTVFTFLKMIAGLFDVLVIPVFEEEWRKRVLH